MFSILKFILFITITFGFGFVSLSQLNKIKSLVLLIPFSLSFGISIFVFMCHFLASLIGPQRASIASIMVLFFTFITIFLLKRRGKLNLEQEIKNAQLITIILIATIICTLTYLGIYRYGIFDKESH